MALLYPHLCLGLQSNECGDQAKSQTRTHNEFGCDSVPKVRVHNELSASRSLCQGDGRRAPEYPVGEPTITLAARCMFF